MSSYPSTDAFAPEKGSYREPTQKSQTFIAGDGGGRVYVPAWKSRFYLKHTLAQADLTTLIALYNANVTTPVDFVWIEDGLTYSCYFEFRPDARPDENGRWAVSVQLVEQ